ncbi:MAG: hypothetical protein ACRD5J_12225 [Nitrososphaeraceae archaeon]
MKGYSKGLLAAGVVLILVSFLIIFPYVGYNVNKQYANVTAPPMSVTGLDPEDTINLYIFVVLFFSGVGLLVKGYI